MPAYHFAVPCVGSVLTLTGTVVATSRQLAVEAFKSLLPSNVNLTPSSSGGEDWADIAINDALIGEQHIVRVYSLPDE